MKPLDEVVTLQSHQSSVRNHHQQQFSSYKAQAGRSPPFVCGFVAAECVVSAIVATTKNTIMDKGQEATADDDDRNSKNSINSKVASPQVTQEEDDDEYHRIPPPPPIYKAEDIGEEDESSSSAPSSSSSSSSIDYITSTAIKSLSKSILHQAVITTSLISMPSQPPKGGGGGGGDEPSLPAAATTSSSTSSTCRRQGETGSDDIEVLNTRRIDVCNTSSEDHLPMTTSVVAGTTCTSSNASVVTGILVSKLKKEEEEEQDESTNNEDNRDDDKQAVALEPLHQSIRNQGDSNSTIIAVVGDGTCKDGNNAATTTTTISSSSSSCTRSCTREVMLKINEEEATSTDETISSSSYCNDNTVSPADTSSISCKSEVKVKMEQEVDETSDSDDLPGAAVTAATNEPLHKNQESQPGSIRSIPVSYDQTSCGNGRSNVKEGEASSDETITRSTGNPNRLQYEDCLTTDPASSNSRRHAIPANTMLPSAKIQSSRENCKSEDIDPSETRRVIDNKTSDSSGTKKTGQDYHPLKRPLDSSLGGDINKRQKHHHQHQKDAGEPPSTNQKKEDSTKAVTVEVEKPEKSSEKATPAVASTTVAASKSGNDSKKDLNIDDNDAEEDEDDNEEDEDDDDLTPEQHRDLVAAIFEIGLKNCSPSVIMDAMQELPPFITRERTKSHLQKYRKAAEKSKEDFLDEYDAFLKDAEEVKQKTKQQQPQGEGVMKATLSNEKKEKQGKGDGVFHSVLAGRQPHDFIGGEAAALVTFSVTNNSQSFPSTNEINAPGATYPNLTEKEKGTTVGKSLRQVKGMLKYLSDFLMKSRHGMTTSFGVVTRRNSSGQKIFGQLPPSLDEFFPGTSSSDDNNDDESEQRRKLSGPSDKFGTQTRRKKTDRSFPKPGPGLSKSFAKSGRFPYPGGINYGHYPYAYPSMAVPGAPYPYPFTASLPPGMAQQYPSMPFPPPSSGHYPPPYPHHQYAQGGSMLHPSTEGGPPPVGYYPPPHSSIPEPGYASVPEPRRAPPPPFYQPPQGGAPDHHDSSMLGAYEGGQYQQPHYAPHPQSLEAGGYGAHHHEQNTARYPESYENTQTQQTVEIDHHDLSPVHHQGQLAVPQSPIQYRGKSSERRKHSPPRNYDDAPDSRRSHHHKSSMFDNEYRHETSRRNEGKSRYYDAGHSNHHQSRSRSSTRSRSRRPPSPPPHDERKRRSRPDTSINLDSLLQIPSRDKDDEPQSKNDDDDDEMSVNISWEPLSIDIEDHRSTTRFDSRSRQNPESPPDASTSRALEQLLFDVDASDRRARAPSSKRPKQFFDDVSP